MAKKVVRIVNGDDLREMMEKYENVSFRSLSNALEVNYGAILKGSKTPIAGQIYDPEAVNWDQVATEFAKRNANFLDGVDWEELNAQSVKRVGVEKNLDEFGVGDKVYIRKYPTTPYTVVWKTETHIVIQSEDSTEPKCWSHGTLLLNGPSKTPRNAKTEEAEIEETK